MLTEINLTASVYSAEPRPIGKIGCDDCIDCLDTVDTFTIGRSDADSPTGLQKKNGVAV